MNAWHSLTQKLPLEDDRDVFARVGFRFIWCTGPYLILAIVFSLFGNNRLLTIWPLAWMVAIPWLGGAVDYWRLKKRPIDHQQSPT